MTEPTKYTWSSKDVADFMGVTVKTVIAWVRAGDLRALDVGTTGKPRYRFDPEDVRAFLEERTTA